MARLVRPGAWIGAFALAMAACGSVPESAEDGVDARGGDGGAELDGARADGSVDEPDAFTGSDEIHRLQPLAVGSKWTWQVTFDAMVIFLPACEDGFDEQAVLRAEEAGGRPAAFLENFCGESGEGQSLSYGPGSVDFLDGDRWQPYLIGPLAEGASFAVASYNYTWSFVPGINTPAGSFYDCWSLSGSDAVSTSTGTTAVYCPDVGAVSIRATDRERVIVDAQLLSFTPGG